MTNMRSSLLSSGHFMIFHYSVEKKIQLEIGGIAEHKQPCYAILQHYKLSEKFEDESSYNNGVSLKF